MDAVGLKNIEENQKEVEQTFLLQQGKLNELEELFYSLVKMSYS